jgi:hypothetical protein
MKAVRHHDRHARDDLYSAEKKTLLVGAVTAENVDSHGDTNKTGHCQGFGLVNFVKIWI